jgi:hypothetical protein
MRQLETSGAHLHGARERTFDVPEELGFHQAFGNGCGVEGDKRLIAPRAVVVNRPCDQLFAGPRFPLD